MRTWLLLTPIVLLSGIAILGVWVVLGVAREVITEFASAARRAWSRLFQPSERA